MEPIDFTCELALVKAYETKGEFHVVGYACTTDFDLQGDVISHEALKDSERDLLSNSTMLFNHDDECPIGRIVKQTLDVKGMLIDAIIDKVAIIPKIETKVIDAIKQKILNKFSIKAKVLDAGKEFVSELGRVANVIKKMLLIECSLVSVPANPEAKALAWYITKALDGGLKMEEEKDEVMESEGLPEVEDLEKKKSDEEEDEEEEEKKGKKKEIKLESQKGFPAPEVLEKEWADLCKEKELTAESEADEVNETWKELCEKQAYPSPYPYPYPSAKREATDQIMFLCDKLIGGADKKVSAIAQEIKAITSRLVGETYPYPKPYPYPQPSKSKEADGEEAQRDDQNEKSAKLIAQLMKDIASIKKSVEEQKDKEAESKIVRKGLVKDEEVEEKEDTVEKGLDKELENKAPDEQLRILVARQEG